MSESATHHVEGNGLEETTIDDFGGTPNGHADDCADPKFCVGVESGELPCFECFQQRGGA